MVRRDSIFVGGSDELSIYTVQRMGYEKKQKAIYNRYGLEIDRDTINKPDIWEGYLKKVFAMCTESKAEVEEILKDIQENCSKENMEDWKLFSTDKALEITIKQLLEIIYELESYKSDIIAEMFMAWLWSYDEFDIK